MGSVILVSTQYRENYGAHDWDGEGECPQYWKMKGGEDYKIVGVPEGLSYEAEKELVNQLGVEYSNCYSEEYIITWSRVSSTFVTENEKVQLEIDGKIEYPAKVFQYYQLVNEMLEAA